MNSEMNSEIIINPIMPKIKVTITPIRRSTHRISESAYKSLTKNEWKANHPVVKAKIIKNKSISESAYKNLTKNKWKANHPVVKAKIIKNKRIRDSVYKNLTRTKRKSNAPTTRRDHVYQQTKVVSDELAAILCRGIAKIKFPIKINELNELLENKKLYDINMNKTKTDINKTYYKKNKSKWSINNGESVLCSCGKNVSKINLLRHMDTALHKRLFKKKLDKIKSLALSNEPGSVTSEKRAWLGEKRACSGGI
jgi:post-segregation antitoxin (ccd killing protein)